MPTLNIQRKKKEHNNTPMRELRRTAYNNTAWRKLRNYYMKLHPLCEHCLSQGRIVPAEDIHHKKSPFASGAINYELLLDEKNLESLCKECHASEHNKTMSVKDTIKLLDFLFGEEDENIGGNREEL